VCELRYLRVRGIFWGLRRLEDQKAELEKEFGEAEGKHERAVKLLQSIKEQYQQKMEFLERKNEEFEVGIEKR
jgi:hypothetical protein